MNRNLRGLLATVLLGLALVAPVSAAQKKTTSGAHRPHTVVKAAKKAGHAGAPVARPKVHAGKTHAGVSATAKPAGKGGKKVLSGQATAHKRGAAVRGTPAAKLKASRRPVQASTRAAPSAKVKKPARPGIKKHAVQRARLKKTAH